MSSGSDEIPRDWDSLADRGDDGLSPDGFRSPGDPEPQPLTLMAASWADLVGMLAVCTGCLITLMALGQRPGLATFVWAALLSLVWWGCAAAVLVVVRQGTPGMLLAGIRFDEPVGTGRVIQVLAAALFGVVTLGLPGLLGSHLSLLRIAAAAELVTDTAD